MFNVYKRYPFHIPLRTKIINIFRYLFKTPVLEKFLVSRLLKSRGTGFWKRFIPPLYFYGSGSKRSAQRNGIYYQLDLNKLIEHSIYFNVIQDDSWSNLFKIIKPNFTIIDVGANIGYLTLNFAKLCSTGTVFGFEPDSVNYSCLQKNIGCNNFRNIKAFKIALSAEPGRAELYKLYENNPGANRILSKKPDIQIESETVEVSTLDQYYQQNIFPSVDLLKVDVEGFELFVLRGASELLKNCKPLLFVELAEVNLNQQNCTVLALVEYIENLEYEVLDARTMLPIDKSFKGYHTDIICSHKSRSKI